MVLQPTCCSFIIFILPGRERLCIASYFYTSFPCLRQARTGLVTRTFHPCSFSIIFQILSHQTGCFLDCLGLLRDPITYLIHGFLRFTAKWIVGNSKVCAGYQPTPNSDSGSSVQVPSIAPPIRDLDYTALQQTPFLYFGSYTSSSRHYCLRRGRLSGSILPSFDPSTFRNAPAE